MKKKFTNKKFYIAIGRLTRQKNFIFLIESIKEILRRQDFSLLILGDGEQKDILQKMIKNYQLEEKIFLLGFKNNTYQYLSKAKGLICSSCGKNQDL